jgi:hypothetical protein
LQKKKKMEEINTTPFYVALVVVAVAYVLLQKFATFSVLFGYAFLFLVLALIVLEGINSSREKGIKSTLLDLAIIVVAVVVVWAAMGFFLRTGNPMDVVPSCSMLPSLKRGDLILLQGVTNESQIVAPTVSVNSSAWGSELEDLTNVSMECVAYRSTPGGINIEGNYQSGDSLGVFVARGNTHSIMSNGSRLGLIGLDCGVSTIRFENGTEARIASTKSVIINNISVSQDLNNSIVVYQTVPQDSFYQEGDLLIVHRALAKIDAGGSYYVLTWGDNNQGPDVQYLNLPPKLGQISGRVVASIPYLGYLKLAFSGQEAQPQGCNYVTQH